MIVNSVIAALITGFEGATPTAQVFDGPDASSLNKTAFVLVGSTGDEDEEAVLVERTPSPLAFDWFDETGSIDCCAVAWSGGTDVAARRAASFELATQCVNWLRSNRYLGGVLASPYGAEASGLTLRQTQTEQGVLVRVLFTVAYRALIT